MEKENELVLTNLVLPVVKELLLPKIKAVLASLFKDEKDVDIIKDNFTQYLSQQYEKFLTIDTLALPNKQTLLKLLYEPLTVITHENARPVEILIDGYNENFLPKFLRIIIEDTAGMGKSTLTKRIFLSIIEKAIGIPVLIELRQINKENNFITDIQTQFSRIGEKISLEMISGLLDDGQFIFLLDGFDEVAHADRAFVNKELHKFIEKGNNNSFLITSRPEDSLVSFGDFQKFTIKPLKKEQAFSLIKRYDNYNTNKNAAPLIKQLQVQEKSKVITEYLGNPLLVSLLYKCFDYKKDIPLKKTQFYRQVFDSLYESHDLSKEGYLNRDKYSHLHQDDFERVLRHVAFLTSIQNKVEYDKDYIIKIIDEVKTLTPDLSFNSSDLLKDLIETVPLFKKEGNNFRWAHKSLQDYFAAKFIWNDANDSRIRIIKKIYNDIDNRRFSNVINLYCELDPKTFEQTFLMWLLEEFVEYYNNSKKDFKYISKQLFEARIELTFGDEVSFIYSEDDNRKSENLLKERNGVKSLAFLRKANSTFIDIQKPKGILKTVFTSRPNLETLKQVVADKYPNLIMQSHHDIDLGSISFLEFYKIYNLDNLETNILNQKENFGVTNTLLGGAYKMNCSNCIEKLNNLKLNISVSPEKDKKST